jgi:CO/xanthine dehydrogenase FAD-binding subunit
MMRSEIDVLTPQTLDEALGLLQQNQNDLRIIAGGSDVIVQLRDGIIKTNKLLNILLLNELRYIRKINNQIHIGSLATYSDIVNGPLTKKHAWILVDAAKQIGAIQLQNTAKIGGNLGNASPAGDSLPPLYALDTVVVTRNKSGRRESPIENFFLGYRKADLKPDELIEEVYFDALDRDDCGAYVKLGLREVNAISIVDVAVVLRGRGPDNSFSAARVALGAVAPMIKRARKSEQELIRKPLGKEILWKAASRAAGEAAPITDIRGSAEYRKDVIVSLVYQALHEAVFEKARPHE